MIALTENHPRPAVFGWVLLLTWVVAVIGASTPAQASNSQQVQALLAKMSSSGHQLNYRGHFTYEHGSALESFKVLHWVVDGVEYERLSSLSGPEREVIRQGRAVTCASPGEQLLRGRLQLEEADGERLSRYYQLDVHGEERVAGRAAQVLQIVPRDSYRYGYLLSIDRETGLLLKALLIDENRRVLERFQFVALELNPELSEAGGLSTTRLRRVADLHLQGCDDQQQPQAQPQAPRGWTLSWLPPGFVFSGQQQVRGETDMLMYTDGLSTFSVFLEPVNDQIAIEGRAQRGATNAYMGRVLRAQQDYRVTVVGELPIGAAERVAAGLAPGIE